METFENVIAAVHGGAGIITKAQIGERESAYHAPILAALSMAYQSYMDNKPAIDIVEAAVTVLENHPLFNAGRGSVLTHAGIVEMDAAIMSGHDLAAGAVTQVTRVRNPISVAKHILLSNRYVMLAGLGADAYVDAMKLDTEDLSYFVTKAREAQLTAARLSGSFSLSEDNKFGTVGAVAVDINNNLAAGTSTGGMTNKDYGRVGDSPIIGSGTFADNRSCAVSATGHGEYFIRTTCASAIAARVRYLGETVHNAATHVVCGELMALGGMGGVIGITCQQSVTLNFNCTGMYRGVVTADGRMYSAIYEPYSGTWTEIL